MAVLGTVLEIFTGFSLSGTVTHIVAVVAAAMDTGQQFFKRYQAVPDSGFAWRAAFQMTLVEIAISTVFTAVFLWFFPSGEDLGTGLGSLMTVLVPLMVFLFAVSLVAKRYMFVSGARQAEKVHLKNQAKNSTVFE